MGVMNTHDDDTETSRDAESQQRYVYGLALAYRLFNVVELVESVAKGDGKSTHWRDRAKKAQPRRVARLEATPSAERAYIARVAALKRLNVDEEQQLARRMQAGDELARNLLVSANLGLVVMFARQYARSGASIIDLVAEGNIGLLQATRTFDPERGFRFATYAKRPITQAMVRALPRLTGAVTVPLNKYAPSEVQSTHESAGAQPENSGNPSYGDLGSQSNNDAWLNQTPIPDAEEIPADEKEEPLHRVDDLLRDQTISRAMECLAVREREIVSARFGLNGLEPQTLATLATRFGISIERVRQIEYAGLQRLARQLQEAGHSLDTML